MSTLALHQQGFQNLLNDVINLEVALRTSDSLAQTSREIELTHIRFETLREQLSSSYGSFPDGTRVVESDLAAFWMLCRDKNHSNVNSWKVSDVARLEEIFFSSVTEIELSALPLLSKLKAVDIQCIDDIDCAPLGALSTLEKLRISKGFNINLSFIERLINLTDLDLENLNLSSVESIPSSPSLRVLSLGVNPIKDISAIGKFPNLKKLILNQCDYAVDIDPLINLPLLESLIVRSRSPEMTISLKALLELSRLTFVSVSYEIAKYGDNQTILEKLEERKVKVFLS